MGTRGGKRAGAGRKPKSEEAKLIEKLSPLLPDALKALEQGLKDKQNWAVKMFFDYYFGKPREMKEAKPVEEETKEITVKIKR